jgi:hypothetical protein
VSNPYEQSSEGDTKELRSIDEDPQIHLYRAVFDVFNNKDDSNSID